jgi:hypothetical protein
MGRDDYNLHLVLEAKKTMNGAGEACLAERTHEQYQRSANEERS